MFDSLTGTITMGNRRPTDCKNNLRTYLPEPRPVLEEAELLMRKEIWSKSVKEYMQENCDENGVQDFSNLDAEELKGINSLLECVKAG